jgi:hypothetical protein
MIMAVSFIGGGNRRTWGKPPIDKLYHKTAANLITDDKQSDCLDDKEPNKGFCSCRNICSEIK